MSKVEQEPDWLAETLQSAVHHARRDRSEETLMRLAQDSLLLSEYIRRSESDGGLTQPASTTHHRFALDIPGTARHGQGHGTSRYKLDSFSLARMTQGTAVSPEAFVADDEDRRLALDADQADGVPALEPGFRMTTMRQVVVAGMVLLILLMVLITAT